MYRASRISDGRKWWRRFRECAGGIWYGVQFGCWRGRSGGWDCANCVGWLRRRWIEAAVEGEVTMEPRIGMGLTPKAKYPMNIQSLIVHTICCWWCVQRYPC